MTESAGKTPMKPGTLWLSGIALGLTGGAIGSVVGSIARFLLGFWVDPYGEPFTIIPIPFAFCAVIPLCGAGLGVLGAVAAALASRLRPMASMKPWIVITLLLAIGLLCGCLASLLFTPQAL